jgi:hypothetical protein
MEIDFILVKNECGNNAPVAKGRLFFSKKRRCAAAKIAQQNQ